MSVNYYVHKHCTCCIWGLNDGVKKYISYCDRLQIHGFHGNDHFCIILPGKSQNDDNVFFFVCLFLLWSVRNQLVIFCFELQFVGQDVCVAPQCFIPDSAVSHFIFSKKTQTKSSSCDLHIVMMYIITINLPVYHVFFFNCHCIIYHFSFSAIHQTLHGLQFTWNQVTWLWHRYCSLGHSSHYSLFVF